MKLIGPKAIAQSYAERCLAISQQHGFRQWLGLSRAIRDICAAALDQSTSSRLHEVKGALEEYQRAGYQLGLTVQFVLLCPLLLLRNEPEAALETIEQGLAMVTHNSERFFEAELYRLKARTLLLRGAPDAEVECLFDQALLTARGQLARSLDFAQQPTWQGYGWTTASMPKRSMSFRRFMVALQRASGRQISRRLKLCSLSCDVSS